MEDLRWQLYILRCGDGTFYTGISVDADRRYRQHCKGKGARYTRGRGPLKMMLRIRGLNRSRALKLENAVKRLTRKQKEALIASDEQNLESYIQKLHKDLNQPNMG